MHVRNIINKVILLLLLWTVTSCARREIELFPEELPKKEGRKDMHFSPTLLVNPQQVNIEVEANGNYPKQIKPEYLKYIASSKSSYCHPDVEYFPNGFRGYKYWMVFTPYFGFVGIKQDAKRYENPTVVVSNDGINWEEPPGVHNPIQSCPGYKESFREKDGELVQGFWSDVDWSFVNGQFELYYRGSCITSSALQRRGAKSVNNRRKLIGNAQRVIVSQTSRDGINWDPMEAVFDSSPPNSPKNSFILSPSIVKVGDEYISYEVELNSGPKHYKRSDPSFIVQRKSSNGLDFSPFSKSKLINFLNLPWIRADRDYSPWHLQATYVDGYYFLCIAVGNVKQYTSEQLYLAFSSDGENFYVCPDPMIKEGAYRSAVFPISVDADIFQFGAILGYKTGIFQYAAFELKRSKLQEMLDIRQITN